MSGPGRRLVIALKRCLLSITRQCMHIYRPEAELNDRVYRLFGLTADEINLLQREAEH